MEGEKGWYWKSTVEMLFGMVHGGEGGENERCEVTRWSGDGMKVGGGPDACRHTKIRSFQMWLWRRMERISWKDKVNNEDVLRKVTKYK